MLLSECFQYNWLTINLFIFFFFLLWKVTETLMDFFFYYWSKWARNLWFQFTTIEVSKSMMTSASENSGNVHNGENNESKRKWENKVQRECKKKKWQRKEKERLQKSKRKQSRYLWFQINPPLNVIWKMNCWPLYNSIKWSFPVKVCSFCPEQAVKALI